jgi:hypothetical protein
MKRPPMQSKKVFLAYLSLILALVLGCSTYRAANQTSLQKQNQQISPLALDISVCDPANEPFSLTIDNEFFPLPVGMVQVLEGPASKVQISVLDQTETVAGVVTRVVEEREWESGVLAEVSRNFFVQAPDGSVCYYGEAVDDYKNGKIVGHGGAWRAGVGQNKPGIIMPAQPAVGQVYQQEVAPGVAMDQAEHVAMGQSFTTPAGTFYDALVVKETPPSTKRYQRGIGLIFDDGIALTKY